MATTFRQPNILLFVTDDHGQWACGPYGNQEVVTPNLDRLAASGVVMENAFTPTPVCSPARASLMTGLTPSQHGVHDYIAMAFDRKPWLAGERTLPQLLQEAGYRTGLAGKWHAGNEDLPANGFSSWFSVGSAYPLLHEGTRDFCNQGRMETFSGTTDDIIASEAVRFVTANDERPFFLLVGLTATHGPWSGHPERLTELYRDAALGDIPVAELYPFGDQALESLSVDRGREREAQVQYYAAVSHVDEIVGQLLQAVEETGKLNNTLVVYTSDHGLNCGHHGIWGKGNGTRPLNMVEESIRVPLILSWPGVLPAGVRREELVDHLDLFQTLTEAGEAQLPPGADYAGSSMRPLLLEPEEGGSWRDTQFGEYGTVRMARTRRFKLVHRHPSGPHELFDVETDPRECHNLFDSTSHQAVSSELLRSMEWHFRRYSRPDKNGTVGAALPQHNMTEAWRV
ncbi:MAG: sulfatase-like hydrolase/transferase [Caldilineaceae bacterium SB0664_bin_27]|uniref:Sulfatase-like hydrolase/transferase n=1 Tax=Caldilineaceae bacterium SB0664_bin_27 TaxID=2605260 RepID=A0A6B0YYW1_9CHLR|nr:sulfatase-like hydrolase/transferase [Caldilineaceae bacterium SB0664_bin_27]